MKTVILIGIKHCGKSTLGKLLAKRYGCDFLDSDEEIEKTYFRNTGNNLTTREIYKLLGEENFRKFESEVICSIFTDKPQIVALGGGAAANPFLPAETLKRAGNIIWLNTADDIAYKRVIAGGLPPFLADAEDPEQRFSQINAKRREQFAKIADAAMDIAEELDKNFAADQLAEIVQRMEK